MREERYVSFSSSKFASRSFPVELISASISLASRPPARSSRSYWKRKPHWRKRHFQRQRRGCFLRGSVHTLRPSSLDLPASTKLTLPSPSFLLVYRVDELRREYLLFSKRLERSAEPLVSLSRPSTLSVFESVPPRTTPTPLPSSASTPST